jgi:hypothetical protein
MTDESEFVGGLGDVKRPSSWPFLVLAAGLVGLVLATVLSWGQLKTAGRAMGDALLPYSVEANGGWASQDIVTGSSVNLWLKIKNSDVRAINGVTVRTKKTPGHWKILGARPDGQIKGESVFYPAVLKPGASAELVMSLLPVKAGEGNIQMTLTPGNGTMPMQVRVSSTTTTQVVVFEASPRDPTDSDAAVSLLANYDQDVAIGVPITWRIRIQNAGPVRIKSVTLNLANLPRSFEFTSAEPAAMFVGGASTVRFGEAFEPGERGVIAVSLIPHARGKFHIPVEVYLSDSAEPVAPSGGGPALTFDVNVN